MSAAPEKSTTSTEPLENSPAELSQLQPREGKIRYGLAAWLVGLPLPIVLIALFIRGCDW